MTCAALRVLLRSLEERRKKLKMPLDILAARSALSRATVCRILSGKHTSVSILNVAALAEALGVTVELRPTEQGIGLEFTPTEVEDFVEKQAHYQAKRLVGMVQGTMGLEAQALDASSASELVDKTRRKLANSSWKKLWVE
jgi:transcriptional regulator with XRE-family HTH domain